MKLKTNIKDFITSIGGRLLLISIVVLCLSQIASLVFFTFDKNRMHSEFTTRILVTKLSSVINLLDKTQPSVYNEVIGSGVIPGLLLYISKESNFNDVALKDLPIEPENKYQVLIKKDIENKDANIVFYKVEHELDYKKILDKYITQNHSIHKRPHAERPNLVFNETTNIDSREKKRNHEGRRTRFLESLNESKVIFCGSMPLSDGLFLNFVGMEPRPFELEISSNLALAIALFTIIGSLFLFVFFKVVSAPLASLAEQFFKISTNYKAPALEEKGPKEIKDLISSINRMQKKLVNFISDRTRIIAAISHDLKTPLTSLSLRAEFLPESEDKKELIKTINLMTEMVKATLRFAKSEESIEEENINLNCLIADIIKSYQAKGSNVTFVNDFESQNISFLCNQAEMYRVLQNLIDNALFYGEIAQINLEKKNNTIVITIMDNGPGIEPKELENVFEPFVRLDKARSTKEGHVGLGLSIVRNIVLKQGGKISLENREDSKGLKAIISYER